jgi:hypothetical protein
MFVNLGSISSGPPDVCLEVAALCPTKSLQTSQKDLNILLRVLIVSRNVHEHGDPPHALALLRPRPERPSSGGADKRYEFAPSHLQSSSFKIGVEN